MKATNFMTSSSTSTQLNTHKKADQSHFWAISYFTCDNGGKSISSHFEFHTLREHV